MAITKAEIAEQFNTLVRDNLLTPVPGTAPWYKGNVPGVQNITGVGSGVPSAAIQNHIQLGPRAEPQKTAADIPGTQYVFFFNNLAVYATSSAALSPNLALYFPIPGGQVEPGTVITLDLLNDFLDELHSTVQVIRTSDNYLHTWGSTASCHSSCHSSCHGSRGRR